jgi:LPS-assembly protein
MMAGTMRALLLLLTMTALAVAAPARAQLPGGSAPALLQADEMTQDRELGTVVAKGNVEITQGERILFADVVSYNQKSNTVTASGNVILLEPDGDTIFAEYVELSDEMREGVIKEIRILLSDDSRFAASIARRTGGNRTVLTRAVYSPCKVCRDKPGKPPLWRLKAGTIIHDKAAREIRYQNVRLEMFGIPVAYSPYFSHPDPSVDRKSGFLTPSFGTSGNLGAFLELPYFWAIDQNSDATFVPIFTRDEGIIFSGEYRQRFDNGEIELSGSVTEADRRVGAGIAEDVREDEIRGHLFARGHFDLDDTWRTGFDVNRASDRSYLRRFSFFGSSGNSLKTNAYIEGFRGRNYAAAKVLLFQDLRSGQRPNEPKIAPLLDFNHVGEPTRFGGRFSIDANARSLYRKDAADSQRLSLKLGYSFPYTADAGFVTTLRGSLQNDLYYVDQAQGSTDDDGFTGRIFPQISVDWRFPFVRRSGTTQQIIEPIAALVVSPNGSNPSAIPIEDSVVVEIDDTSILSADRFPGIDRVESGQKIIFGLKLGIFGQDDSRATAFIGQSYRIHADNDLKRQVGIEGNLSDIVGRLEIRPNRYMDVLYRFRADNDTFEFRRNEIEFSAGPAAFRLSGNYIFIDDDPSDAAVEKREELRIALTSKIDDFWSISLRTQRDLRADGGTLFSGMQVRYEDECFIFTANAERSFTRDADFEPTDKITFRLTFKNLGSLTTAAK